jgi:uroporphyrinogen-III decarboxylase
MDRRLMDEYEKRLGHRHWRVTHYGADVIETFPLLDFPTGPMEERDGTSWLKGPVFDDWNQADELAMPDPRDDTVYGLIKADLDEFPDKAVILDMQTPWGIVAGFIRGYEHVYLDMCMEGEAFKKLCSRILEVQKVVVERVCAMGITALYLMEELATSQGLSMSLEMTAEYVFAYAREMAEIARAHEIPILWHSDGNILGLIEHLVGLGVKAVNPLQPNVNDTKAFMERFGGRLAVYGGIDNCFIIPESSPEGVRQHVLEQFDQLGQPHGGLIFSTHDIPLKTPRENVEMMVATIVEECVY